MGLTLASDGNLYGAFNALEQTPLFPATTAGAFTTLATLGSLEFAFGLVLGANGNLYGTLEHLPGNSSIIFEVELDGSHLQVFGALPSEFVVAVPIVAGGGNLWSTYTQQNESGIVELSPENGSILQTIPITGKALSAPRNLVQAANGLFWGDACCGDVLKESLLAVQYLA